VRKWIVRFVVLAGLVAVGWWAWGRFTAEEEIEFQYAGVVEGPLSLTVTATGRLAPTTEVLVGCEVSGTIEELTVGHNDVVRKGQVLARLKPELFRAEYEQARAEQARLVAQLAQLAVHQREAQREFERVVDLRKRGAATEQEYEARRAAYDAAAANTQAGEAAIEGAASRVELAKYRLDRTVIASPIDGVVLDRRVDVGQTVVAALQTPTLFVLAEDLARMELRADVSEADVGYVCPRQPATFTVNAYRDRTFEGVVRQIRNQPRTLANVVTYTVIIDVDNAERLLRPGMPADVSIEIVRRDAVAKIANAALRFRPPIDPDEVRRRLETLDWPDAPEPIRVIGAAPTATRPTEVSPPAVQPEPGTLWLNRNGQFVAVPVWTLFTDNRETAIVGGPSVTPDTRFVVEVRRDILSRSVLEEALMQARPEDRRF